MSILKFVIFISFMLIQTFTFASASEKYVYLNPFDNSKFFSISDASKTILLNDMEYDFNYCNQTSEYVCIESDVFNFAVPRKLKNSQNFWKINGVDYRLKSINAIYLLGLKINIFNIVSNQGDYKYNFLYSEKYGLIGFKVTRDMKNGMFLSIKPEGYGAKKKLNKK